MPDPTPPQDPSPRFMRIQHITEKLATTGSQVYALLRTGELQGIQIGGRKQWRIERSKLEEWIQARYQATRQDLTALPSSLDEADQQ